MKRLISYSIIVALGIFMVSCHQQGLSQTKQCEVSYETANNQFFENRLDQALIEIGKAIEGCPKVWKYWYLKAQVEYRLGNLLSANDSAKQTVKLDSNCAICYDFLGIIATDQKNWSEAYSDFQKALTIKDYRTPVVTIYNLGILFEKQGKYKEALDQFEKACKIDPSYDRAFLHKGDVLMMLNRPEDAIVAYKQTTVINKKICDAWVGLVKAYRRSSDFRKATETVQQACQELLEDSKCCKNLQLLLR